MCVKGSFYPKTYNCISFWATLGPFLGTSKLSDLADFFYWSTIVTQTFTISNLMTLHFQEVGGLPQNCPEMAFFGSFFSDFLFADSDKLFTTTYQFHLFKKQGRMHGHQSRTVGQGQQFAKIPKKCYFSTFLKKAFWTNGRTHPLIESQYATKNA